VASPVQSGSVQAAIEVAISAYTDVSAQVCTMRQIITASSCTSYDAISLSLSLSLSLSRSLTRSLSSMNGPAAASIAPSKIEHAFMEDAAALDLDAMASL